MLSGARFSEDCLYQMHNSTSQDPSWSKQNHFKPSQPIFMNSFNMTLPYTHRSLMSFLPFIFPAWNFVWSSHGSHWNYTTHLHYPWFDALHNTWWCVEFTNSIKFGGRICGIDQHIMDYRTASFRMWKKKAVSHAV
jgi:hypothetical protein